MGERWGGGVGGGGPGRGAEGMRLGPEGQEGRQGTLEAKGGWGQSGWMRAAGEGLQENRGVREKQKGALEMEVRGGGAGQSWLASTQFSNMAVHTS